MLDSWLVVVGREVLSMELVEVVLGLGSRLSVLAVPAGVGIGVEIRVRVESWLVAKANVKP